DVRREVRIGYPVQQRAEPEDQEHARARGDNPEPPVLSRRRGERHEAVRMEAHKPHADHGARRPGHTPDQPRDAPPLASRAKLALQRSSDGFHIAQLTSPNTGLTNDSPGP